MELLQFRSVFFHLLLISSAWVWSENCASANRSSLVHFQWWFHVLDRNSTSVNWNWIEFWKFIEAFQQTLFERCFNYSQCCCWSRIPVFHLPLTVSFSVVCGGNLLIWTEELNWSRWNKLIRFGADLTWAAGHYCICWWLTKLNYTGADLALACYVTLAIWVNTSSFGASKTWTIIEELFELNSFGAYVLVEVIEWFPVLDLCNVLGFFLKFQMKLFNKQLICLFGILKCVSCELQVDAWVWEFKD